MKSTLAYIAFGAALLFGGCAGISVKKISQADDATDKGLRFYRNVPYLLITTNNAGGVATEVVYLPDTNELMSAYVYSRGATNDTTLKFKNSVLTSSTVDVDTSIIPKAILSAVSTIAGQLFNKAGADGDDKVRRGPGPYLYRIKVKGDQVDLIGSHDVITINIGTEAAQ